MDWPVHWVPQSTGLNLTPQQEFKNLLTLFVKVLQADLGKYQLRFPQVTHLQDMDDVVMVTEDETSCQEATDRQLTLQTLGYWVSDRPAQLCTKTVTYLEFDLHECKRVFLHPASKPSWGSVNSHHQESGARISGKCGVLLIIDSWVG